MKRFCAIIGIFIFVVTFIASGINFSYPQPKHHTVISKTDFEKGNIKGTANILRLGPKKVAVILEFPKKVKTKVESAYLVSPQGKRYKANTTRELPGSQLSGYLDKLSFIDRKGFFIQYAYATCGTCGVSEGEGKKEEKDTQGAALFMGLLNRAMSEKDRYVSVCNFDNILEESGTWMLSLKLTDDRGKTENIECKFDLVGKMMLAEGETEQSDDKPPHTFDIDNPTCHHCQGGRLLIIAGTFDQKFPEDPSKNPDRLSRTPTDPDILGTLAWARKLKMNHLHKVAYRAPRGDDPIQMETPYEVRPNPPNLGPGTSWQPVDLGAKKKFSPKDASKALAAKFTDCCYFDEVMIIMHGSQYAYPALIEFLPHVLDGKPVRKLVIWSCRSTRKLFPTDMGMSRYYQKICGIVKPKPCPCECDHDKCIAKDSDNRRTKCPTERDKTKVYASYVLGGVATKLGLDTADNKTPFMTPDGRLREITVNPDGKIEARAVDAAGDRTGMLGGKGVKAEPKLGVGGEKIDEKGLLQDSKTIDPPKVKSSVPKSCPGKEGCQLGSL